MSKTKLSKGNIITIEEYWYGINQLRKDLKFREWELLEDKKNDENIGGGKTNRNWTQLDATDAVTSVFGRTGNVVATSGAIS